MFAASTLIAGGSRTAALEVWSGRTQHAVNIAGGLHHAMRDSAAGFCVINDVVLAIRALLEAGAQRVAYVDIDVHHGDGVQAAFYDDPRVLTVSMHQDPRTLYPGTGMASETGRGAGEGSSVNLALPPATSDDGWLRAFAAVVPGVVTAFKPEVLVTQCGCDTHHEDPLADLSLTVDGQRAAYGALHELAHTAAGGKWLALGGGGYGVLRCVPRAWTHLLAEATGRRIDPATEIPQSWTDDLRRRGVNAVLPTHMGEGRVPRPQPWHPGGESWLDRAIWATRDASYPLLGLDPHDLRD
jgi:acetoin utilization protein AcuC